MTKILKANLQSIFMGSLIGICLLWAASSQAGAGPHVKIFDGSGPITVLGEGGYHEILSWSWGRTSDGAKGDGGGIFNDFAIVLPSSNLTPRLLEHFCAGSEIGTVTMTTVIQAPPGGAGNTRAYHIALKGCYITSYQTGGSAGDVVPTDQVTLNYSKIETTFEEIGADGSVKFLVSRECVNPARQTQ